MLLMYNLKWVHQKQKQQITQMRGYTEHFSSILSILQYLVAVFSFEMFATFMIFHILQKDWKGNGTVWIYVPAKRQWSLSYVEHYIIPIKIIFIILEINKHLLKCTFIKRFLYIHYMLMYCVYYGQNWCQCFVMSLKLVLRFFYRIQMFFSANVCAFSVYLLTLFCFITFKMLASLHIV